MTITVCSVEKCNNPLTARQLCDKHYRQFKKINPEIPNLYSGLSKHPLYSTWLNIKSRCYRPTCREYKYYGKRGIEMHPSWIHSFSTFIDDMGPKPTPLHSVERLDNSGNYEPGNCIWATHTTQANNRRSNRLITYKGQTRTMTQWSRIINVKVATIWYRLEHEWPIERVLDSKVR